MTMGNEGDGEKFHTHAIGVVVDYSLSLSCLSIGGGGKRTLSSAVLSLSILTGRGGGGEGCVYAVGFFSVEVRPTKKRSWWRGDKNTRTHDEDRKCMCAWWCACGRWIVVVGGGGGGERHTNDDDLAVDEIGETLVDPVVGDANIHEHVVDVGRAGELKMGTGWKGSRIDRVEIVGGSQRVDIQLHVGGQRKEIRQRVQVGQRWIGGSSSRTHHQTRLLFDAHRRRRVDAVLGAAHAADHRLQAEMVARRLVHVIRLDIRLGSQRGHQTRLRLDGEGVEAE